LIAKLYTEQIASWCSFIVSPNWSALSHEKSASTDTLHDSCCA